MVAPFRTPQDFVAKWQSVQVAEKLPVDGGSTTDPDVLRGSALAIPSIRRSKYGPSMTCFFLVWMGFEVWALILRWHNMGIEDSRLGVHAKRINVVLGDRPPASRTPR